MFTLTENAAKQVVESAKQNGDTELALRFAVEKKEDGSLDYRMGFDKATGEDVSTSSNGVNIVFHASFTDLLKGTTMDYVEMEPNNFHFIFLNPNDPNFSTPAEQ